MRPLAQRCKVNTFFFSFFNLHVTKLFQNALRHLCSCLTGLERLSAPSLETKELHKILLLCTKVDSSSRLLVRNQAGIDTAYRKKKKKSSCTFGEGQSLNTAEEQALLWTYGGFIGRFSGLSRPDGSAVQRRLFGPFRVFTSGK